MIKWKKWNRDLLPNKWYLVLYKGYEIREAEPDTYKTDDGDAPIFVDREGNMLSRVTHYAETNLPIL